MSKRKPEPYKGDNKCEYGCNQPAKFLFLNGKFCCASQGANCKSVRATAGQKISKSKNTEVSPGIKLSESAARKAALTKSLMVDSNGKNKHQINAERVAHIKSETINENGLNIHQIAAQKYSVWAKTDKGIKTLKRMGQKTSQLQNVIDPISGLSEAKRRAKKMIETKLANIDQLGLNGFDRAHWKNKNSGFIDGIYYQSSNEKRFLETMKALGKFSEIKRGSKIGYKHSSGELKTYLPDYIIGDMLYEIKSRYTMFGVNNTLLENNVAKLLAAEKAGYTVYAVIDDKFIKLEDFIGTVSHLLKS